MGRPVESLVGQSFGVLTVVSADHSQKGRRRWLCNCECGGSHIVTTGNLRSGRTTNCGCRKWENSKVSKLKHGQSRGANGRSKLYRTWAHIRGRCNNPTDAAYPNYGGRGIFVCNRWGDFEAFAQDMGEPPSPDHTIERIDNDGPYSPDNCRWATMGEQTRNTRRTVVIDGLCLADYCKARGLSYEAIQARIRRGHPMDLAVSPLTGAAYRAMINATTTEEINDHE